MTLAANPTLVDVLQQAASRAALAPSVHNTQPWRFSVTGDSLEIRSDMMRRLKVLDPRARQLTISCGCALFNARVAIAAAGFEPIVTRFPDPESPDLLARVSVGDPRTWVPIGALDTAIDDRRTNRRAFALEPVPASVVHDLVVAARSENGYLVPITTPEHLASTAELSRLADRIQGDDPDYLAELRAWTTDDPRRRDGVQAATVPYAGVLSDVHDEVPIRSFDVRGMGWLPSSSHSDSTQCLVLLAAVDDDVEWWLRTGEALERVWLELTRHGYAASPLTQVVETVQTRERLRAALEIDLCPQILLRVGLAPQAMQTPRRHPSEVMSADQHC
jgi:hypothetical protein